MLDDKLTALHKRYRLERNNDQINLKEFEHILMMFPAVLVLKSDGHIDTTEMMYLSQLAKHMSSHNLGISEADLRQEIRYLAQKAHYWREPFMEVLRAYVHHHKVAGEVVEIMIASAASSTGNVRQNIQIKLQQQAGQAATGAGMFISEEEKEAILNLVAELEVGNDERVIEQLAGILA